jgi:hypothetical protein
VQIRFGRMMRPAPLEPAGEATDSIAVVLARLFFSSFSAQKTHVKSQNHLTNCHTTTSALQISYPQPSIMNI